MQRRLMPRLRPRAFFPARPPRFLPLPVPHGESHFSKPSPLARVSSRKEPLMRLIWLVLFCASLPAYASELSSSPASETKAASQQVRSHFQEGKAAYSHMDFQRAFQLILPAAEQGDAEAQNYIGFMYHEGRGVKPNKVVCSSDLVSQSCGSRQRKRTGCACHYV